VAKDIAVFQLTLRDGSLVEVEGNALLGSPENRVKKKPRRRW
jgi:RNase P/RNase MRP subunit p29